MIAVDFFAGIGGFTTGAKMAGVHVAWAANHWPAAVDMHARNHPETIHACQDLQQVDMREVPAHDLLLAAPACQGHTHARGKEKPHHDALRSTAWAVISDLECNHPDVAVVENVTEFTSWTLFPAWCAAAEALGYAVSPHVIDAADHGVPQHRLRAFILLTRSKHPMQLKLPRRAHVGADQIIRFDHGKWSPVDKPGRSIATLHRVRAGRARFGNQFVMPYYGSGSGLTGRCITRPLGTITTVDRWAVVDGDRMRMLSKEEARAGMSFPLSTELPEQHRMAMHMLGNAVCPVVGCDVITAIRSQA